MVLYRVYTLDATEVVEMQAISKDPYPEDLNLRVGIEIGNDADRFHPLRLRRRQ